MTVWQGGTGSNPHYVGLNLWITNGNLVNWELRVRATYAVSQNQNWQVWGAASGSGTYRKEGPGEVVVASGSFWGNWGQRYEFGGRISGIYGNNNNVPDVYDGITVPGGNPSTPTWNANSILGPTGMRVVWNPSTSAGGTGLAYELRTWDDTSSHASPKVIINTSGTSWDVYGLLPARRQYWGVRAYDSAGSSGWSNIGGGWWIDTPPGVPSQPAAPFASHIAPNSIRVNGFIPANNGAAITQYQFQRATNATFTANELAVYHNGQVLDMGSLAASTTYYFRYRAFNSAGVSEWSPTMSATTGVSAPAAPSGITVTRHSDLLHSASWTNNPTGAAPYTNIVIQRTANRGEWITLQTLPGTATSFNDNSTRPNSIYAYRVYATNGSGASAITTSSYIQTTPTSNISVQAFKDGSNILVLWNSHVEYDPNYNVELQRREGTGSWMVVGTISAGAARTWTHVSPNLSVTHTYRVRNVSVTPVLYSEWATSNIVQLATPPYAPTIRGPVGTVPASTAVTLQWTHNSTDTSVQSKYSVRHRPVGSSTWQTATVSVNTPQHVIAAGYYGSATIEWQVQTWGDHIDPSPWSAVSTFRISNPPSATITAPTGTQLETPNATITWAYNDVDGDAHSGSEIRIRDAVSTTIVWSRDTVGAVTSVLASSVFLNNGTYQISVRVLDSSGLWSSWANKTVTVLYPTPSKPTILPRWNADEGNVLISITNPEPNAVPRTLKNLATNPRFLTTDATAVSPDAVNYARNPRATSNTFALYTSGSAETGTTTYLSGQTDGPPGITSYMRRAVSFAKNSGSSGINATGASQRVTLVGVSGHQVTASVWVRYTGTGTQTIRLRADVYTSSTLVTSATGAETTLVSGVWQRISSTVTATGAFDSVGWYALQVSGTQTTLPASSTLDATGAQVEVGGSLRDYFDGTYPDSSDGLYTYDWAGTVNASVTYRRLTMASSGASSVLRQGGGGPVLGVNGSIVWKSSNGLSVTPSSSTLSDSGAYMSSPSTGNASGTAMAAYGIVAGKSYAVSVDLFLNSAQFTPVLDGRRILVGQRTASGVNPTFAQSSVAPNTAGTHRLIVTFTVPAGTQDIFFTLVNGSAYPTDTVEFRNFMVVEGTSEADALQISEEFFDGATPPRSMSTGHAATYAWDGTANNSTTTATLTVAPSVVYNDVYRRLNGGDWVLVVTGVAPNSQFLDYESGAGGTVEYQAVAFTSLPSATWSNIAVVSFGQVCSMIVYISAGDNFNVTCQASYNLTIDTQKGLTDKVLHQFARRTLPVEFSGHAVTNTVSLSWAILPDFVFRSNSSSSEEWEALSLMPGPHFYRDTTGKSMYVSLDGISLSDTGRGYYEASTTLTEVERA